MIVPFRGEFYQLKPEAHHLVPLLIYPVPDPNYPFLGVHFTRRIDGARRVRPERRAGLRPRRLSPTRRQPPRPGGDAHVSRLLAAGRRATGGSARDEMWRSFSKPAFVRALQRLVPEIESKHLDWAPAGVRAQAVSPDGQMVDDFVIEETDRVVNVENAPSPAATASLNIGRLVVDRLAPRFA